VETSLPKVGDDEYDEKLSRLIGQQYLPVGKKGVKRFSVTFRTDPHPTRELPCRNRPGGAARVDAVCCG